MKRKPIIELTAAETIAELKKTSLNQTSYTCGGLVARLVVIYTKAFTSGDVNTQQEAEDHLEFLLNHGSEEVKALVAALYVPG